MNLKTSDRQAPSRHRTAGGATWRPARFLLHLAILAVAILTIGCSNSPYPEKDANTKTLYNSMTEEPLTLDPAVVYGGGSQILMDIVEPPLQYSYVDRP